MILPRAGTLAIVEPDTVVRWHRAGFPHQLELAVQAGSALRPPAPVAWAHASARRPRARWASRGFADQGVKVSGTETCATGVRNEPWLPTPMVPMAFTVNRAAPA